RHGRRQRAVHQRHRGDVGAAEARPAVRDDGLPRCPPRPVRRRRAAPLPPGRGLLRALPQARALRRGFVPGRASLVRATAAAAPRTGTPAQGRRSCFQLPGSTGTEAPGRLPGSGCGATAPGGTQMATPAAFFCVVGMPTLRPPAVWRPKLPAPTDMPTGDPDEPTPTNTTPLAPSAAASRLSRATAASVWPWVPKPTALEASSWAMSCEPGGGTE